jgi:hypothetical protein
MSNFDSVKPVHSATLVLQLLAALELLLPAPALYRWPLALPLFGLDTCLPASAATLRSRSPICCQCWCCLSCAASAVASRSPISAVTYSVARAPVPEPVLALARRLAQGFRRVVQGFWRQFCANRWSVKQAIPISLGGRLTLKSNVLRSQNCLEPFTAGCTASHAPRVHTVKAEVVELVEGFLLVLVS